MKPAVLFDLGNTLAAYYDADQFQPILKVAIATLLGELESRGLSRVSFDDAFACAIDENKEAADFRFTPMAERFERIFQISLAEDALLAQELCEIFLQPIFSIGRVYDDSLPVLHRLRGIGYPVAIVSNAPWGSPPNLWRNEIRRLGLLAAVDRVILCGDVGWRKPARAIFEYAASTLDHRCEDCIFVGDDLRWDMSGSEAAGMRPILIDRGRRVQDHKGERIEELYELLGIIEAGA